MRMIITAVCLAIVCNLSSCFDKSAKSDTQAIDPAGTYTLISVDDVAIPGQVMHGQHEVNLVSGTFIIHADGTCVSHTEFGPPAGNTTKREVHATYTLKGSDLLMKWKGAGRTTGTIKGDVFIMNNEGMFFKYQREVNPDS